MQFFIPMQPPTTTHNAKQLHAFMRGGKPCAVLHDSPELKATRAKLHAYLAPYAPPTPCSGPVRLLVKWLFPTDGRHNDGEWRTTKPDTDNLEKALKDEMTRLHFWRDDAFVCSEVVEKFWPIPPAFSSRWWNYDACFKRNAVRCGKQPVHPCRTDDAGRIAPAAPPCH